MLLRLDSEPCSYRALNITSFLPEKLSDRESYDNIMGLMNNSSPEP